MKKFLAIFCLVVVITPTIVLAQTSTVNPCSIDALKGNADVTTTMPKCINQIYVWSLGISVLLAMLMIVVGGYYYMTSGGNAEQASKGKDYITSALIGIVILFCAYLLLNTINPDLVNFNLNSLKATNPSSSTTPNPTPPATQPHN